jgi:hypothetical protein
MNKGNDDAMMGVFLIIMVVALAIGLTITIFFYLSLSRCLSRIQPRNREMEPSHVWLNLIPCFGIIWIFFTIIRIANSLRKEYWDRGWRTEGESFGQGIGLAYAILMLLGGIPYIGFLFSIASFVCFIMYWVQIAGFSRRLAEEPYDDRRDYDEDYYADRKRRDEDYYDDRRRREVDDRDADADPDTRYRR